MGQSIPTAPAPADPSRKHIDLAWHRPVDASSFKNDEKLPKNVVDGNPITRWTSAYEDDQWLTVDLGEAYDLHSVEIRWEVAHAVTYHLHGSVDGNAWAMFAAVDGREGWVATKLPARSLARWVRLYCVKRVRPEFGFSLFEIRIFERGELRRGLNAEHLTPIGLRMPSGRPLELKASSGATVADARRKLGRVFGAATEFVRLVTDAGGIPDDNGQLQLAGVSTLVLDSKRQVHSEHMDMLGSTAIVIDEEREEAHTAGSFEAAVDSASAKRPVLTIEARRPQTGLVVLLHGNTTNALSMKSLAERWAARLPHAKVIAPSCPTYEANHPTWFTNLLLGISKPWLEILNLVEAECNRARIPISRVVLAGVSQGGHMAAWVALQLRIRCAGLVMFLTTADNISVERGLKGMPVFHGAGGADHICPEDCAKQSCDRLRKEGLEVTYHMIPHLGHDLGEELPEASLKFLEEVLPQDCPAAVAPAQGGVYRSVSAEIQRMRQRCAERDLKEACLQFEDSDGDTLLFRVAPDREVRGGIDEYCNGKLEVKNIKRLTVQRDSGNCDDGEADFTIPEQQSKHNGLCAGYFYEEDTSRRNVLTQLEALFMSAGAEVVFSTEAQA